MFWCEFSWRLAPTVAIDGASFAVVGVERDPLVAVYGS